MKYCVFYILLFLFIQFSATSQNALRVMGEVSDSYGALEETTIKIKNDSSVIETFKTNRKGAFYFDLSYGFKYLVSFSKVGYSRKNLIVNTKLPEKIPSDINQLVTMKLELIEKLNQTTQKSDPLGEISFNRVTKEFSYESKYSKNSFTNIEVAGTDYYLSKRRELGLIADKKKKNQNQIPLNEISYKEQKLNFFEKIKEKRKKLLSDNSYKYKNENNRRNLVEKMPLDTSISSYTTFNMDVIEVIFNNKKILRVYHRVEHEWGGIFYFKNYRAISKTLFYLETELNKKRLRRSTSIYSAFNSK